VGKGAGECWTKTERAEHAQEEDDVSRRSEEDCRSTTSAVGEVQGGEEGGLRPRDWARGFMRAMRMRHNGESPRRLDTVGLEPCLSLHSWFYIRGLRTYTSFRVKAGHEIVVATEPKRCEGGSREVIMCSPQQRRIVTEELGKFISAQCD
jgi:hypothetical protein